MWYPLFIIRIWREYILKENGFNLKDNFLTSNCYNCIELNAHSLVLILVYLKDNNLANLFTPELYSSQPCEALFRQVRSFTTTYSTVANCSVKEILGRMTKIQLQSDIALHNSEEFVFPRIGTATIASSYPNFELPTRLEIYEVIEKCKIDALKYASLIGLIKKNNPETKLPCKVVPYVANRLKKTVHNISTNVTYRSPNEAKTFRREILKSLTKALVRQHSLLKNYSQKYAEKLISETCPYIEISLGPMKSIIVKKSFLCWLLCTNINKLSSDRLERVKSKVVSNYPVTHDIKSRNFSSNKRLRKKNFVKRNRNT